MDFSNAGRPGHVQTYLFKKARQLYTQMTPNQRREMGLRMRDTSALRQSSGSPAASADQPLRQNSGSPAASADQPRRHMQRTAARQTTGRSWTPKRRFRLRRKSEQNSQQLSCFRALLQHWTTLPADLDHWIRRYGKYRMDFSTCKGVLIAVVNLKLGPVRGAFLRAWRAAVASTGPTVAALEKAFAAAAATVVASDILSSNGAHDPFYLRQWSKQCNSTTAFHHGSCAYLRRWGVIEGGSQQQPGPLRVVAMGEAGRGALVRLLGSDAHSMVESITPMSTLQEWVAQVERLAPEMERLQLPGLRRSKTKRSYGVSWTLRCLLLGVNFAHKPASGQEPLQHQAGRDPEPLLAESPEPLRHEAGDSVALLRRGFPDMGEQVNTFALMLGVTTVGNLVAGLHYRSGIEFLCMDLCLAKPVYRWLGRHQLSEAFVLQAAPHMMLKAQELYRIHHVLPSLVTVLEALRVQSTALDVGATRPAPEPASVGPARDREQEGEAEEPEEAADDEREPSEPPPEDTSEKPVLEPGAAALAALASGAALAAPASGVTRRPAPGTARAAPASRQGRRPAPASFAALVAPASGQRRMLASGAALAAPALASASGSALASAPASGAAAVSDADAETEEVLSSRIRRRTRRRVVSPDAPVLAGWWGSYY